MRLREIHEVLRKIDAPSMGIREEHGASGTTLKNLIAFKSLILTLEPLDLFDREIGLLQQSVLYHSAQDEIHLPRITAKDVMLIANYLVSASEALGRTLERMIGVASENTISVKMPDPKDFNIMVRNLGVLQKAIEQVVVNDDIKGQVKISRWEEGSFWLELLLATPAAVLLIGSIAWSAAVVFKKIKEGEMFEQHARSLALKGDSLEDLLTKQKEMTALLVEHEATALRSKHFASCNDPEISERLKHAIKTFAELIREGAQIHPALNAPENVQNLFPNFNQLDTISSSTKMISDG